MARIARKVVLSDLEKAELNAILKKGTHKSRKILRARALLLLDKGKSRSEVESELGIDSNHYYRIRKRYFTAGLSAALEELPRSGQPRLVSERLEAQITSLACSQAPDGATRWTLSLINEKMVELNYVESISNESIRQVLKKAGLSLG